MRVEMRDGAVLKADPAELVGYTAVPMWKAVEDPAFA
jgi:hypothetical protein